MRKRINISTKALKQGTNRIDIKNSPKAADPKLTIESGLEKSGLEKSGFEEGG